MIEYTDFNGSKDFNLNRLTHLKEDTSILHVDTTQSLHPGIHQLENLRPSSINDSVNVQTSQVGINFVGGYNTVGEGGNRVDKSTYMRTNELTNLRKIYQLNPRFTLSVPYIKGFPNVDVETKLISSDNTLQHRTCNTLSGKSLLKDYIYTPMIQKLEDNIQDTDHIIPEDSKIDWVRGGSSTRQLLRNATYKNKCSKNNILNKVYT